MKSDIEKDRDGWRKGYYELQDRITELEKENRKLRTQLEALRGLMDDVF